MKWSNATTDLTRVFVRHFRFPTETIGRASLRWIRFLVCAKERRSQHSCTVLFGDAYALVSQFILSNLEVIRAEWESFASTVLPKSNFDQLALRDEADEILKTIANDMETPQTASEQAEKSKGRGPRVEQDSAAETHGADRLRLGFNQAQVVSEYRALRATVIRLWIDSSPEIDHSAIDQLFRFNEGIDQALSESAARFMQRIEESRDFSIAVLAHDLRNPLNVIISSAQCFPLVEGPDRAAIKACASAIFNSGMHMSKLIENLLDFLERASDSLCLSSANQWILPQFVGRPSGNSWRPIQSARFV